MGYVDGQSVLVANMAVEASRMETYPVLIGTEVAYFHRVGGGYDKGTGHDVVKFIHDVQGCGSPNHIDPDQASHSLEAHLSENYYNLTVSQVDIHDEYPKDNYVFTAYVEDYEYGEQSFNEPLRAEIDKRDVRFDI